VGRLLIACAFACVVHATAGAQDLPPSDPAEYRRVLREAIGEFNAGRFEEARALFRRAHEISPSARTLRSIGMASYELREYGAAFVALNEALASTGNPLNRRQRREVEELVRNTRTFLGRFYLVVEPPEANVTVDGEAPVRDADGSILLGLGPHTLAAEHAGFERGSLSLEVQGGEERELQLRLEAIVVAPEPAPPPPDDGSDTLVTAVLFSSAGALLVAAIGGALWIGDRAGEIDRCRNPPDGMFCLNPDALSAERNSATGFTVAMSIASGLTLAAAFAWWFWWSDADDEEETSLACAPSILGAACRGAL
jgi:tetratricopeptide (TPR) repeat protein